MHRLIGLPGFGQKLGSRHGSVSYDHHHAVQAILIGIVSRVIYLKSKEVVYRYPTLWKRVA
jgi:hypothetical protein